LLNLSENLFQTLSPNMEALSGISRVFQYQFTTNDFFNPFK